MDGLSGPESDKKTNTDLQEQIRRHELSEQRVRSVQHKLDTQIELFSLIHKYSQQAFNAAHPDELSSIIAEGIADIFQLEIGAVFVMDPAAESFTLTGSFNTGAPGLVIPLSKEWARKQGITGRIKHNIILESPTADDSPWKALGIIHAVYVPIIGNDGTSEGVILGGVSESGQNIYDFHPTDILSSFMVYCQQMNGIYNNFSAMVRVQEADSAKTVFLANLSHEMRTPMNAIIGMAQKCKKNDIEGSLSKEITQIEISSKHLLGLINDILDISKIEGGKLVLENEAFCLKELADNLLLSLNQTVEKKNQDLVFNYSAQESSRFIGDPMRLFQVLLNLLSNAIKFTPESGRIDISIEELSREQEKTLIKFSVRDTGIGITPEFLPKLFLPFEQADGSASRKYGGTGLGLAISRRIVEQMGSEIHVESEVGKGTHFYFTLWLVNDEDVCPDGSCGNAVEIPDLSGKTALIVDDVDINREIIVFMLEQTGISIENAQNGKIALDMVESSAAGYYSLILMDIQMPVMDGYAAARSIRALDRPDAKDVIILAMTANAFKEDIDQALDAGMNGHMSKPVDENTLLGMIADAFQSE